MFSLGILYEYNLLLSCLVRFHEPIFVVQGLRTGMKTATLLKTALVSHEEKVNLSRLAERGSAFIVNGRGVCTLFGSFR